MYHEILIVFILASISQKALMLLPGYVCFDGHAFLVPRDPKQQGPDSWAFIWTAAVAVVFFAHLAVLVFDFYQGTGALIQVLAKGMWVNIAGLIGLGALVYGRSRFLTKTHQSRLRDLVGHENPQLEPDFPKILWVPLIFYVLLMLVAAIVYLPDQVPINPKPGIDGIGGRSTGYHTLLACATLICLWTSIVLAARAKRLTIIATHQCSVPATLQVLNATLFIVVLLFTLPYSSLMWDVPFLFGWIWLVPAMLFELPLSAFMFVTQYLNAKRALKEHQLLCDLSPKEGNTEQFAQLGNPLSVLTPNHRHDLWNRHHPHVKWIVLAVISAMVFAKLLTG